MYSATWFYGVLFFSIATIVRYRWLNLYFQAKFPLQRLFAIDKYVSGSEVILLASQLIGISWFVLGVAFMKIIIPSSGILSEAVNEIIWGGPVVLFSWLLRSRIKKQ